MKAGTYVRFPGVAIFIALLLMLPLPAAAGGLAANPASPAAPQELTWVMYSADQTIDVGTDTSLALDSRNIPFISYYDRSSVNNGHLKFARWAGCEWETFLVDGNRNVGTYTSLRLDANNVPHISYYDQYNKDLKYATYKDASWVIQVVDATGSVGQHTSLDLDADGHPHISYYDSTNSRIKYAQWTGSQWTTQVVGPAGTGGGDTSLHLDGTSRAHISYQNANLDGLDGQLMYAHWDGAAWLIEPVDNTGSSGGDTSLDLDGDGYPHISYYAVDAVSGDGMVRYAYKTAGGWQKQHVDGEAGQDVGLYTSLELDMNGRSHLSYLDLDQRILRYAFRDGGIWSIVTVDSAPNVGGYSALALEVREASVIPHISYHDYGNESLRFAIGTGEGLLVTGPAAFLADKTGGLAPLTVAFTDDSRGSVDEWAWDFGNNSTWGWNVSLGDLSQRHPPSQTYTEPGTYTVTLSVTGVGGTHSLTEPSFITVYEQVQAAFSADVTSGPAPLAVQFTDASTGSLDTLVWDFGDGTAAGAGASPAHTYAAAGVYTVKLTATGPGGSDTETKTGYVQVTAPAQTPQPPLTPGPGQLQAAFTGSPTSGKSPLVVQFRNTSTGTYDTSEWGFGDGGTSTEPNPSHTYTQEGTYNVALTVRGAAGSSTVLRPTFVTVGQTKVFLPLTVRPR